MKKIYLSNRLRRKKLEEKNRQDRGSSGWETAFRKLNRRDCPPDRSLVSLDLSFDEISATGGHRSFAPR